MPSTITQHDLAALRERAAQARAAVERAEEDLLNAQRAARQQKLEADALTVQAADDRDFHVEPHYAGTRGYVLPFGRDYAKWHPLDVDSFDAFGTGKTWLRGMTAIIVKRQDKPRDFPTRLIFSSGSTFNERDGIGVSFTARHDQTGALLGTYRIVGLVFYGPDGNVVRAVGDIGTRKLSLNTYK